MTVENIKIELQQLLSNKDRIAALLGDYADLKKLLSEGGNASAKAAHSIFTFISAGV
jgi:lipid-A-disaccharide synthase